MKHFTLLLFSLIIIGSLKAQDNIKVRFDHVALSVSDVDRSADFYSSILNLDEITNRSETEGIRWFSLGEGKELHLISIVEGTIKMNKAVHFALSTSRFDSLISQLQSHGVDCVIWSGYSRLGRMETTWFP